MLKIASRRLAILVAMSNVERIQEVPRPLETNEEGIPSLTFPVPDAKRWNFISRFRNIYGFWYHKDLENLCEALIKAENLGCEKIVLIVHKEKVLESMMAIAGYLLKTELFTQSDLRIIILRSAVIKDSRLQHVAYRHKVPMDVISDSKKEDPKKPLAEIHRLLKT